MTASLTPGMGQDLHSEKLPHSVQALPESEGAGALALCPRRGPWPRLVPTCDLEEIYTNGLLDEQDAALGRQHASDLPVIRLHSIFFLKTWKQHPPHLLSTCVLVRGSLVSRLSLITADLADRLRRALMANRRQGWYHLRQTSQLGQITIFLNL